MAALHDAYELGGIAGHGRTTLVRLAVRRGDCRPVALKQLRMEHAVDADKRARFIAQYRRACMLAHDNIETLIDITEGDDGPVAVAEWIDGRSLLRLTRWRRDEGEPWHPTEVLWIAQSLLEALRYAHNQPTSLDAQGMLHGGIWPGNVLIDVEGAIKLVDFGMASVWQEGQSPWQNLEALRYLSADQVRHGPNAAADLFAIGAIVHELLSGQRFREECETESEMRAAIDRLDPPPRPSTEYPAKLEQLRIRLLQPVPNPRLTLEHLLDLCATMSVKGGKQMLSTLVRRALRTDTTSPGLDESAPGASLPELDLGEVLTLAQKQAMGDRPTPSDGVATARARPEAEVHLAAGRLAQVPIGKGNAPPRPRDTQSVPVPVDHEQTAPRVPLFLHQTAPPQGQQARDAELRRSGVEPLPEDDTAPIQLPDAPSEAEAVPREVISDEIEDPGVTAEVTRIPQLPEDQAREEAARRAAAEQATAAAAARRGWLHGPVGWALLGAAVVGIGLPLIARCSAAPTTPAATSAPAPPADPRP